MIIVCCGPPCSGKSAVARKLSERLSDNGDRVEYTSVDQLLTELIPDSDRNIRDRTIALDEMHRRASASKEPSVNVVLDSTYTRRQAREQLHNSCGTMPMVIIELVVQPDVAVRRFETRGFHDAIDQTSQSVRESAEAYPWSTSTSVTKFNSEELEVDEIVTRIIKGLRFMILGADDVARWVAAGR